METERRVYVYFSSNSYTLTFVGNLAFWVSENMRHENIYT